METIEHIHESNINTLAALSTLLWPDVSLDEMILHYQKVLDAKIGTCFLLRDATSYIGFIELSVRNDYVEGADELPVAYIEGIFIKEEYRHKHLGSLLIQEAENWARSKGFKQICSDTEQENELSIAFHNAIGFTEVSRIVCFAKNLT